MKKAAAKRKTRPLRSKVSKAAPLTQGYGSEPGFPISLAMRAGDFVFTSAQGDHEFDPNDVVYDENGKVVRDGNTLPPRSVADETRETIRRLEASLKEAGCTLDDVVDVSVWLRSPQGLQGDEQGLRRVLQEQLPYPFHFRNRFHVRLPR